MTIGGHYLPSWMLKSSWLCSGMQKVKCLKLNVVYEYCFLDFHSSLDRYDGQCCDMELLDGEENQYITCIAYLLRLFWRRKVILLTFTSIVVMYLGWKPYALFVRVKVCLFSMTPIAQNYGRVMDLILSEMMRAWTPPIWWRGGAFYKAQVESGKISII